MDKKDRYLKVLHSAENILKDYKIDEIGKMSFISSILMKYYNDKNFIRLDGKSLPFRDKEFDFVITVNIMITTHYIIYNNIFIIEFISFIYFMY